MSIEILLAIVLFLAVLLASTIIIFLRTIKQIERRIDEIDFSNGMLAYDIKSAFDSIRVLESYRGHKENKNRKKWDGHVKNIL